jgi:hypothetical protein
MYSKIFWILFSIMIVLVILSFIPFKVCSYEKAYAAEIQYEAILAHVTGYNLVPEQTDETPCIGASGKNLCGAINTLACPRKYPLGTIVEIDSKFYTCEDRLSKKYDHRWDVNCDQDTQCPAKVTGHKVIRIYDTR